MENPREKIEPVRDKVFLHKVVCKVLYLQHQNLVCKIDLASSVYRMGRDTGILRDKTMEDEFEN